MPGRCDALPQIPCLPSARSAILRIIGGLGVMPGGSDLQVDSRVRELSRGGELGRKRFAFLRTESRPGVSVASLSEPAS